MKRGTGNKYHNQHRAILFVLTLFAVLSTGCPRQIPYLKHDDNLNVFLKRKENIVLPFYTDKGRQVAFYMPPLYKPHRPPARLAILYPGIGSEVLSLQHLIHLRDDPMAGYLLIDYPGRGYSEGMLHPSYLYKNTEGALAALAARFKIKEIDTALCLMGHSFGTGAALQFAEKYDIDRIVLVAPYNTLKRAVSLRSEILALLMPAQIDNVSIIKTLLLRSNPPEIVIIHGTEDKSLPVQMARELFNIDTEMITYHEIPQGGHINILTTHRDLVFHSLLGIKGIRKASKQAGLLR